MPSPTIDRRRWAPAGRGRHATAELISGGARAAPAGLLCAVLTVTLGACASAAAPAGRPSTADELAALRRPPSSTAAVEALTGELRLRHDGAGERFRGTVLIWLARPDRLRLHVLGPQGSPLAYLVVDGGELAIMDVAAATVVRARADAAALDRLLPLAPIGLDARGWVSLLLGEVDWPATAAGSARGDAQELVWRQDGRGMRLIVDRASGLWRRLEVAPDGGAAWSAEVAGRDAAGLPARLQVTSRALDSAAGLVQTELRLREVEVNPELGPATFHLAVPPGFTERHDAP